MKQYNFTISHGPWIAPALTIKYLASDLEAMEYAKELYDKEASTKPGKSVDVSLYVGSVHMEDTLVTTLAKLR